MDYENLIKIAGVALALSGWSKVFIDHQANKPKIKGRIINVVKGTTTGIDGQTVTSFMPYVYLLNMRKNVIHILDYELYIKTAAGWHQLHRVYGMEKQPEDITFVGGGDAQMKINNFRQNLIYRKNSPAQHGVPLHGWLVFATDAAFYKEKIFAYKLVCIDAGLKRHASITDCKDMNNLGLLQEIGDMEIPPGYQFNDNPKV